MTNDQINFVMEYDPTGIKASALIPDTPYDTTGVAEQTVPEGIGNASADPANEPISPTDLAGGVFNGILRIGGGQIESANFLTGSVGWQIKSNGDVEFNDGVFRGSISATTIDIGGSDATSFHIDIDGNMWAGASTFAAAPFSVSSAGALIATSATIGGYVVINPGTFGGNGADGALTVSSGTTNIDLTGLATFVKNYTSIAITGTGAITFTNPHANGTVIILKSQGAVTITTSATRAIDLRSLGCTAGVGGTSSGAVGTSGTDSDNIIDATIHYGGGYISGPAGLGGLQITQAVRLYSNLAVNITANRMTLLVPGAGGGGGKAGTDDGGTRGNGGNGGRGAGCMIIECAGAHNVTGTIDLSGTAGTNGQDAVGPSNGGGGGGGGGGAGGMILYMYKTLTADSGTYTVTAGAGGSGGAGLSGTGGSGAGGGGSTEGAGVDGTGASGANGGAGGAGAAGIAIRMINNVFA